ncbi:hypothetical protein O181_105349 [Austropuccinia psidii MF-1]|uniref:Uncharacterized protein n=1 Tax=Austropuccinia psidii MF-1 TaxID=1389203 RepID=A0A9Q3JP82_9BASI|nr:hypothetical protein [Austropuccinia psidii MF-1]
MNPQQKQHVLDNPYHKEDIKPDAFLDNKARCPSQYKDGNNMSYSEEEELKKLPDASRWPTFSGTGEYDHMELTYYIVGLFIDVPKISDYWITARLNTEFKVHASIWYTEMKEIHGRRNWPWWKIQVIPNYSNGFWIWKKTMSFENDKYSVDKDLFEWCLRNSKRLEAIHPEMNIQMRNDKLLTQMPGQLEHAVKCRCNQIFTLDETENTLKHIRKRINIGKYYKFKSISFKENKPFRVDFKDKLKKRVAEVTKKKTSSYNCGSIDHYSNKSTKAENKVYAIEQVP